MNRFGFIVHPLSLKDVYHKWPYAKYVKDSALKKIISLRSPMVIGEMKGIISRTGVKAEGVIVGVPLLPDQFYSKSEEKVTKKIVKAAELAAEEGAKLVGLGAFTAIPADNGRGIAEAVEVGITTGNTYTIAIAAQSVKMGIKKMGKKPEDSVLAVFGASGSIGRTVSVILAGDFKKTILIGRKKTTLELISKEITNNTAKKVEISTEVTDIGRADAVVTVSSAADAPVKTEMIKSGAVVCDVARPRDVSSEVKKLRNDVLIMDGGIVSIPGNFRSTFDIGLPPGKALACMAETMILTLEEKFEDYTVGKEISIKKVAEIRQLAEKHGFALGGLRSFESELSEKSIKKIRENSLKASLHA